MPSTVLLVSIVIPTCHRNQALAECLQQLAPGKQTMPFSGYEVIVSDDGGATTAETMISDRFPWAQWIVGPRRGPAANRNSGARIARGAWLAFTDDDCYPDKNWLKAITEAINGNTLALEGAIEPIGNADRDLAECPVNLDGGHYWSANIAVERNLFWEIGGFDEDFPMAAHEDQDLMLRLKEKTPIAFVREAIVRHPVRSRGLVESIILIPARCRAWARFAYKHRAALGLNNARGVVGNTVLTQGRCSIHFLRKHHFRKAVLCILTMLVSAPVIYRFLKHLQTKPTVFNTHAQFQP